MSADAAYTVGNRHDSALLPKHDAIIYKYIQAQGGLTKQACACISMHTMLVICRTDKTAACVTMSRMMLLGQPRRLCLGASPA
jgi:hypothetical protein